MSEKVLSNVSFVSAVPRKLLSDVYNCLRNARKLKVVFAFVSEMPTTVSVMLTIVSVMSTIGSEESQKCHRNV